MTAASATHLVLIPSYNTGPRVLGTVEEARRSWRPVWVVVDGSTDGTGEGLAARAAGDPGLEVIALPRNAGKGAAVLAGIRRARAAGFSHVLTMDSDGQHAADAIPGFMAESRCRPDVMVLGRPVFDAAAPAVRVQGRKLSNNLAKAETLGAGIDDVLFGFRVYPIAPLIAVMEEGAWMRRFDFDPEAAVRLCWRGVPLVNLPAPCRYPSAAEGGVSHFRYGRDNALLTWMHARLLFGAACRLPSLLRQRRARRAAASLAGPPPPRPGRTAAQRR